MKIPLDWLKQYIRTDKSAKELANDFTMIGLLLDKPIIDVTLKDYATKVLDLEHRMDRADWLSILGCARDLACYLNTDLIAPKAIDLPNQIDKTEQVEVRVDCPDLVNRFTTLIVKGLTVKPSPSWLANRLEAYGIASINNVVDVTNYVMVEMGQPMHAQDIAKLSKKEIHIRRAEEGETLTSFLGETIKLDGDCFVLCQNDKPTVLGGIVGSKETGVDKNTVDIVLDAGNYNQVNIRKTSRRLKILNETVLRYDKLLSPKLTMEALLRAGYLLQEVAGGKVYFNNDYASDKYAPKPKTMTLKKQRLELLAGTVFDVKKAHDILKRLGYEILNQSQNELVVNAPHFRTDIDVEDDLVADVLRIIGYDKIKAIPLSGPVPEEITPAIAKFEQQLKGVLVTCGLNEYITSPFVASDSTNQAQIVLDSAVNKDQNALRTSLSQTLSPVLEVYKYNGIAIRGIFELGKVYTKGIGENQYSEFRTLQVLVSSKALPFETSKITKETLATVMHRLGIDFEVKNAKDIYQGSLYLGELAYNTFSLLTEELLKTKRSNKTIKEKVENLRIRDITLIASTKTDMGEAVKLIKSSYPEVVKIEVISEYLESGTNSRTIGMRLYFAEATIDAGKLTNDILIELKNTLQIDNKSLVI